ncbi:unnamed protein product [Didymodactylos carnosus]|uniref:small monomeric GTPase n=1 Tax=Didymodactylos carnosus TaxID=1234261 RepID=A0A814MHV4_9BILA|nr:unnamed protein product [Didymodactylos carnosus]CAF1328574.1 unnamed protein product [Didymodactylos carnosus]CAF3844784.1 unnamed protein product [Didymodactylos carnosus]CAF4139846.1 unnamed protein product [Didymodactylos carnosus]
MSFLWNWLAGSFQDLLTYWFSSKPSTVLLIGLDHAGKTTLTGRLTNNRLIQAPPTSQPIHHQVQVGKVTIGLTDLGGHIQARRLWKDYYFSSSSIIFVVDASDRKRFNEVRYELLNLLDDDDMSQVPMLILGNKIDCPDASSYTELVQLLGIERYLCDEPNRKVKLCMCSIANDEGYGDGIRWLVRQQQ